MVTYSVNEQGELMINVNAFKLKPRVVQGICLTELWCDAFELNRQNDKTKPLKTNNMETYKCVITKEIFDKTSFDNHPCYAKQAMIDAGVPKDKLDKAYCKVSASPRKLFFDNHDWAIDFGDELLYLDLISENIVDKILPIEFEVTI